MKKFVFLFALSANMAYLPAQRTITGSGKMVFREIEAGTFQRINVGHVYQVFVKQGDQQSVILEADDNMMEWVDISVSGHELKAGLKIDNVAINNTMERIDISGRELKAGLKNDNNVTIHDPVFFLYITMPELREVHCHGASRITFETPVTTGGDLRIECSGAATVSGEKIAASNITIRARGAGDVILPLSVQSLDVDASGTSFVRLSGRARIQKARATGTSNIILFPLRGKKARIDHNPPHSRIFYFGLPKK